MPATTTSSAVFLTANGFSNSTVGLAATSVLTVTADERIGGRAGARREDAEHAGERARDDERTAAERRTRAAFAEMTGVAQATGTPDAWPAGTRSLRRRSELGRRQPRAISLRS